jgi:hypothetical protein
VTGPTPHIQLDRQAVKEVELSVRVDNYETVGLRYLRSNLSQVLGARHADRDWQAKLLSHTAADSTCNFGRRPEETSATSNVGKRLVDRDPLNEGREVIEHCDGGIAQPLIVLEVAGDKSQLRAELACTSAWHATANAEGLGLVRRSQHDDAADGDGFTAQ